MSQKATSPRTRVYFTVDVECAEERMVRGKLQPPLDYDLRVWGRFTNQRKELGIGLIMDELEAGGLRGTFFVEPLGAHFFGRAGLGEVCQALLGRGHDIQLHIHPRQRHADFLRSGRPSVSDFIADYPVEEQGRLLAEGLDMLADCGVPRASLLGFRAGHFGASNDTWTAMAAVGLTLSSNLDRCYLSKSCRIRWLQPEPALFDTGMGVWELPISNFVEGRGGYRHVQVSAVSFAETRDYLLNAHRLGIPEVVLLTHSFEYFWIDSIPGRRGRVNRINCSRLRSLCSFLRDHTDKFESDTVGALAQRLQQPTERPSAELRHPHGKSTYRYGRLFEQIYKRLSFILHI